MLGGGGGYGGSGATCDSPDGKVEQATPGAEQASDEDVVDAEVIDDDESDKK